MVTETATEKKEEENLFELCCWFRLNNYFIMKVYQN